MPEERLSISSSARVHPDEVARHTFGTQRRGFDPAEVRTFLEHVARELVASEDREQELRRALSEAENRAANPVLDESTLTAALGLETARVLRSAHEAAAELVARAESDASRLRAQAQEDAEQLQRHTEQSAHDRTAEADAAATELRRRAQEEASARVEGAKLEAEALVHPDARRMSVHGPRGAGAACPCPGRPGSSPTGAAQPDRAVAGRTRAPGRDDRRCPARRRPDHRRALPGRGRSPTGSRGRRAPSRARRAFGGHDRRAHRRRRTR